MKDTYLDRATISPAGAVAEPSSGMDLARELIAQLVPGADADRLTVALMAERDARAGVRAGETRYDSSVEIAARELARVRAQLALGAAARTLQHAFNNPLTALLAEAQLLELEPLPDDHRKAVSRILELARRLVTISRRLGVVETSGKIG